MSSSSGEGVGGGQGRLEGGGGSRLSEEGRAGGGAPFLPEANRVPRPPPPSPRNVHKLLMDTATSEFLFCTDFFDDEGVFRELFAPIVSVVEGDLASALQVRGGREEKVWRRGGEWMPQVASYFLSDVWGWRGCSSLLCISRNLLVVGTT